MKHSLSMEITHSISYIQTVERSLTKALNLCDDAFEYIRDLSPNNSEYNDKIRKKIKDLKDDIEDIHDLNKHERDLFLNDMNNIASNRSDERVIYSLRNFVRKEDDLKDFRKKKLERFIDKLHMEDKETTHSYEMVLKVAYGQIVMLANDIYDFTCKLISSINHVTKKKDSEDDNVFIKKLDELTKPREKKEDDHD